MCLLADAGGEPVINILTKGLSVGVLCDVLTEALTNASDAAMVEGDDKLGGDLIILVGV